MIVLNLTDPVTREVISILLYSTEKQAQTILTEVFDRIYTEWYATKVFKENTIRHKDSVIKYVEIRDRVFEDRHVYKTSIKDVHIKYIHRKLTAVINHTE